MMMRASSVIKAKISAETEVNTLELHDNDDDNDNDDYDKCQTVRMFAIPRYVIGT